MISRRDLLMAGAALAAVITCAVWYAHAARRRRSLRNHQDRRGVAALLGEDRYRILREEGTGAAVQQPARRRKRNGVFHCADARCRSIPSECEI